MSIWDEAKHPRGYHGKFGRTSTKRNVAGQKLALKKPMTPKTRRLKEAASRHHNTLMVQKYVLKSEQPATQLQARYRKARRTNQLGGIFPRDPRATARRSLLDSHPVASLGLSWLVKE